MNFGTLVAGAIARDLVKLLGVYLIHLGVAEPAVESWVEPTTAVVSGVVIAASGTVLSILQKKKIFPYIKNGVSNSDGGVQP